MSASAVLCFARSLLLLLLGFSRLFSLRSTVLLYLLSPVFGSLSFQNSVYDLFVPCTQFLSYDCIASTCGSLALILFVFSLFLVVPFRRHPAGLGEKEKKRGGGKRGRVFATKLMQPKFRISVVNFGNRNEPRRNARSSEILLRLSCTSSRSCSCGRLASRANIRYIALYTYFEQIFNFLFRYFWKIESSKERKKKVGATFFFSDNPRRGRRYADAKRNIYDIYPLSVESVVSLINKCAQWRESFHSISDTERAVCTRIVDVDADRGARSPCTRVFSGNLSSRD